MACNQISLNWTDVVIFCNVSPAAFQYIRLVQALRRFCVQQALHIAHDMPAQVAPDDLSQLIATVAAARNIRVCEGSRIEIDYLLPEDCRALLVGGGSRAGVVRRPPEVYNTPSGRTPAEPSPAEGADAVKAHAKE